MSLTYEMKSNFNFTTISNGWPLLRDHIPHPLFLGNQRTVRFGSSCFVLSSALWVGWTLASFSFWCCSQGQYLLPNRFVLTKTLKPAMFTNSWIRRGTPHRCSETQVMPKHSLAMCRMPMFRRARKRKVDSCCRSEISLRPDWPQGWERAKRILERIFCL